MARTASITVDPLVTAYKEYVAAVERFNSMPDEALPNNKYEDFAELPYRVHEEVLENPGKIRSTAGAHALVQYLARDNAIFGEDAYNPILAALEDFLRRQVEAESKGGRSNG